MTPEQARGLRNNATPGPWELERIDGFLHVVLPTGNGAPEECDLPLIAAAPALAELVAGLRYEYAVQIEDVAGETRLAKSAHGTTSDINAAWWTSAPNTALADHWRERTNADDVRIVRRLVGEPEVVE